MKQKNQDLELSGNSWHSVRLSTRVLRAMVLGVSCWPSAVAWDPPWIGLLGYTTYTF